MNKFCLSWEIFCSFLQNNVSIFFVLKLLDFCARLIVKLLATLICWQINNCCWLFFRHIIHIRNRNKNYAIMKAKKMPINWCKKLDYMSKRKEEKNLLSNLNPSIKHYSFSLYEYIWCRYRRWFMQWHASIMCWWFLTISFNRSETRQLSAIH